MKMIQGNFGKDNHAREVQEIRLSDGSVYRCQGVMFVASGLIEYIPARGDTDQEFSDNTQVVSIFGRHSLAQLMAGSEALCNSLSKVVAQRLEQDEQEN